MSIRGSNYRTRLGDCPPGLVQNASNCIDPTALARECTFGVDTVNGGCLLPTVQQALAFSMAQTAPPPSTPPAPTLTASVPIGPNPGLYVGGPYVAYSGPAAPTPAPAASSTASSILSSLTSLPSWAYWAAGGAALLFLGSGKKGR